MIDISQIENATIAAIPYEWAFIDQLFTDEIRKKLSKEYPMDHYKSVNGYEGEKTYVYECRNLIAMGAKTASFPAELTKSWLDLALDLNSPEYRAAMSKLCKRDLSSVAIEVNLFHYSPGTWMGPHVDLKDKIVTHVLYFNDTWDDAQGGCISILNSSDPKDVFTRVSPITGNSVLLVRSNHSWHAVEPVKKGTKESRRSMTVTFYHPGSISTMWPPDDIPQLHPVSSEPANKGNNFIKKIITRFSSK